MWPTNALRMPAGRHHSSITRNSRSDLTALSAIKITHQSLNSRSDLTALSAIKITQISIKIWFLWFTDTILVSSRRLRGSTVTKSRHSFFSSMTTQFIRKSLELKICSTGILLCFPSWKLFFHHYHPFSELSS